MLKLVAMEQSMEQDVAELCLETRYFWSCAASIRAVLLLLAAEQLLCFMVTAQSLHCAHCKHTGALKH